MIKTKSTNPANKINLTNRAIMLNNHKIYVDTSAFYALMDRSDRYHAKASAMWPELLTDGVLLITSNYVVMETICLLQKRIGFEAANLWYKDILGMFDIWLVDMNIHQRAYELWLGLGNKRPSLVDCVSFVMMHQNHIEKAFCFKPHFRDYGFVLINVSADSKLK